MTPRKLNQSRSDFTPHHRENLISYKAQKHTYKGEIWDIKRTETDSVEFMDGKQAAVHEKEKHPDCGHQKDVPLLSFPLKKDYIQC